jgi:6-phosphogluconolactonase
MDGKLEIVSDSAELARSAATFFVAEAQRSVLERGSFTVALSGGSTPKRLYQLLAHSPVKISWEQIHLFWTDERQVPPDHPESNFRMVHDSLLAEIDIPDSNVHRIKSEFPDPAKTASDYQQTLTSFFALEGGQTPTFDLILLGLGADAHTASIFPGKEEVLASDRLVESLWVEKLSSHRTTMTMRVINGARSVLFLVSGDDKADALSRVFDGPRDPINYPAQAVDPQQGELKWLVDEGAASRLRR